MEQLKKCLENNKVLSMSEIYSFLERNGWNHEPKLDGVTILNGEAHLIYRVQVTSDKTPSVFYGVGSGNTEDSLYNAYADLLQNGFGIELEKKVKSYRTQQTGGYIIPFGKYRGMTLDQVPLPYVQYWSEQPISGYEVDALIKKCKEYIKQICIDTQTEPVIDPLDIPLEQKEDTYVDPLEMI